MPANEEENIDINGMVKLVLDQFPEQAEVVEETTAADGHIIGHTFASYAISQPMEKLFYSDKKRFEKYCYLIEQLWRCGNDEVRNIVDKTILEELSTCEDAAVWKGTGEFFSDAFQKYLNENMIL